MNKQDLVKKIAVDAELTQRQAALAVDSMMRIIMESVAEGEKVQLMGFGTFERRERQARVGRNPATNEPVEIPPTTAPVFKPGQEFKDMVRT